jgi:adenosine kinase
MQMTIVCTGSIAFDYLMTFPGYFRDHIVPEHLDSISLSFLVDHMVRLRGGVAPNIAYTMALLGDNPIVFGTAGEDFGEYRAWLDQNGVNTKYIRIIPEKFTASFFANTDKANNQICSFYNGAMADARDLSLYDFEKNPPQLVVISPNDPLAMDRYVRECKELKIPYMYDPGQQVVRSSGEELCRGVEGAHFLFVNEYEWELLQKHTCLSAEEILNSVQVVVNTLGSKGANIHTQGKVIHVPVAPVEKIEDPTGVGDAFRGGFLRGFELGFDWETCGQMGSLAAAYCLENKGTQAHHYSREEFVNRYRENFDDQGQLNVLLRKS